MKTENKYYFG